MGSFNVSCAVSGLSIEYGDEAYFFLLLPQGCTIIGGEGKDYFLTRHKSGGEESDLYRSSYFIHNDCLYVPFSLPILGSYDDYGSLQHIHYNDNTTVLEEMFGIDVEDIIKIVRNNTKYGTGRRREQFDKAKTIDGKRKKGFSILSMLSGMYVHKDIYEHLATYEESPKYSWRPKVNLPDAYDRLQEALIEFDRPLPVDADEEAKMERHMQSILGDPIRKHPEKGEEEHLFHYVNHRWYNFQQMYRPLIKEGRLKQELCSFVLFDGNMETCNRFYFPGMYSGQDGDHNPYMTLYKKALGVIGRKIAKWSEETIPEQKECKFCKQIKDEYVEDSCQECHLQNCGW